MASVMSKQGAVARRPENGPPQKPSISGVHSRIAHVADGRTPELVMVREALEGVVSPTLATRLLFDSLETWGPMPPMTLADVRVFAGTVLDAAVRRCLLEDEADEIQIRIERLFLRVPRPSRDDEPTAKTPLLDRGGATQEMLVARGPVPVVVLAQGRELADRLTVSLGSDRVIAVPVSNDIMLAEAMRVSGAMLVVIDATSPATVDDPVLGWTLRTIRVGASVVIWGDDTIVGREIADSLHRAGTISVGLAQREGTAPLLDLVRARAAQ